jgi:nucleoid-associated protein YgaU
MRKLPVIAVLIALVAGMAVTNTALAADRMTYEDFQKQLLGWQAREQAALDAIAVERKAIDDLKAQIADATAQIEATWNEIFAALGMTREQYQAFLAAIGALEVRVDELARLAPEKLLERAKELDQCGVETDSMLALRVSRLSEPRDRLTRLQARIVGLKNSLPQPKNDMYTVLRGDYLWRISGKKEIFADPWKWMRIYSANRTDIKNPDLIYPDQRLRVPRQIGRDEHLVVKGEFLAKIAGLPETYGNPFKWTKIYEANKSGGFISDPNLIYPEQILSVPRD